MARSTLISLISILLVVACGAWGQKEASFADGSSEAQRAQKSLPDAPSLHFSPRADKFPIFPERAGLPPKLGTASSNASALTEKIESLTSGMPPGFSGQYGVGKLQMDSITPFDDYLDRLLRHAQPYHPSTSNSALTRTTDAASQVLLSRDRKSVV